MHRSLSFCDRGIAALALLACLTLAGCAKKQPPKSADQPEAAQTDATAAPESPQPISAPRDSSSPSPAPPSPAQASTVRPVNGVVDRALTAQLRIFIQEKGRFPESFAEFSGARLDSVPRLAPGLAFAIDPTTQEVKIVRK